MMRQGAGAVYGNPRQNHSQTTRNDELIDPFVRFTQLMLGNAWP